MLYKQDISRSFPTCETETVSTEQFNCLVPSFPWSLEITILPFAYVKLTIQSLSYK